MYMYTDENNIPGILFFADFEKAFDTIETNSINRALNILNLETT